MSRASIRAINAPTDAVLPEAAGAFLGVLMLDTRFPRLPGDIGHPQSFGVPDHLLAAGVPANRLGDVLVQGVEPQGEFARAILGNDSVMDVERARADVVAAACALRDRVPQLRTAVLECTNMPPPRKLRPTRAACACHRCWTIRA